MWNKSRIALALSLALNGVALAAELPVVDSRTDLGTLSGDNYSSALGVSANGTVVVGYSGTTDSSAIVWQGTSMTSLGSLRADGSGIAAANGVSADGSVVVGYAATDTQFRNAFIWRNGQMESLGTLRADGSYSSTANVIQSGHIY